ncbi:MAG: aminotransferase class III-fold pyridoxal phosphate-dependent enzyme [Flavobacteriaceae bacterium]|nr:aminotransferase class III-fold pyridoxal phosphate-dependent enzyme [Bacteroidia bacterium]NNF73688.1 aminotransferase class III-fold pyridoxal phosphate-dependent enzyme [Flavobacteriaceae bacterium]
MAIPRISPSDSEIQDILRTYYNIDGDISRLDGDVDLNFRIEVNGKPKYILKVSRDERDAEAIGLQADLLNHLKQKRTDFSGPEIVISQNNKQVERYKSEDGSIRLVRMLKWINGRLWVSVNPITNEMRYELGHVCGSIVRDFADFEHPYAFRSIEWDIAQSLWTQDHLNQIDHNDLEAVIYFQNRFEENYEAYCNLRKSVIHNDANDNNIIISEDTANPKVMGLIDFGDAINTQIINELAIACTYAIMNTNDPLAACLPIIHGFHDTFPLEERELEFLYDCVGMRLVISLTKSKMNALQEPGNTYHQVSRKSALKLLHQWHDISPEFALFSFRSACGISPHPKYNEFMSWSKMENLDLKQLFPSIEMTEVYPIDLSVGSTWIGHEAEFNDLGLFEFRIDRLQRQVPNTLIAGGYLEPRSVYTSSAYDKMGNNGRESRTVHLGIDFWLPAYTPVHALFDGEVVTATNDAGDKEYGGLVILKHNENGIEFYTLHGHLTVKSAISHLVGDHIAKGEIIGKLGPYPENGNWVPHLHFQIMLSMLNYKNDFPGVCYPNQIDLWKNLCPDPNLLFKAPGLNPNEGHSEETIKNFRKKHLGKSLSLHYDKPLHIVRGSGVYLIDNMGRKYLDTVNNVAHVGHEHFDVVSAGQAQMALLNTNTRYLHNKINELTNELLTTLPAKLNVLHYVNSGSEANELALRMATTVTGSKNILASQWGYHGNTNACVAVSSYKFDGKGGQGKPEHTHIFPIPDSFRGKYRGDNCTDRYLEDVGRIIENIKSKGDGLAALILEPIISCGGQIELPEGFISKLYDMVREADGICIADEVQTGCARVGSTFWAFQLHDVVPDIVTIGKPLGNGHPIGAVACTKEVADAFANGMEYFSTFGGNPVSCAIAKEVLCVIKREKLPEQALQTGNYLKTQLKALASHYPIIGHVRGQGLFLGIEFVDKDMNPLPQQTDYLLNRMKTFGILMSSDGPDHNVLKIKPPMVFNRQHADELLFAMKQVLSEDFMQSY